MKPYHKKTIILTIVFIFGFLASVGSFIQIQSYTNLVEEDQFQMLTRDYILTLRERFRRNKTLVLSAAGLIHASDEVTEVEWGHFVEALKLHENFPAMQWMGLAKIILSEKSQSVKKSPLKIWPKGGEKSAPIVYVYPETYKNLKGYNLFENKNIGYFLNKKNDEVIQATKGLQTTLADQIHSTLLLLYPVFIKGAEHQPLNYWVVASINLPLMAKEVSKEFALKGIDIEIYLASEGQEEELVSKRVITSWTHPDQTKERQFQFGDQKVRIVFSKNERFNVESQMHIAYLILGLILTATFVVMFVIYLILKKSQLSPLQIKRSSDQKEQGEKYIATDEFGIIQEVSSSAAELLGEQLIEKKIDSILEPERAKQIGEEYSKILNQQLPDIFSIFIAQSKSETPEEKDWVLFDQNHQQIKVILSVDELRNEGNELVGYLMDFKKKE